MKKSPFGFQPATRATLTNTEPSAPVERRRTVIWVHGMGDSEAGYSEGLREILNRAGSDDPAVATIRHEELLYEPINERVATKIRDVDLAMSALVRKVQVPVVSMNDFADATKGALGDVFSLWLSDGARTWVFNRIMRSMIEILRRATKDGFPPAIHDVNIICHSLGTFVTYEFLHWAKDVRGINVYNLRCANVFMLAPVLQTMKTIGAGSVFVGNGELAINRPLSKPWVTDYATGVPLTNIRRLWAYRQRFDPFASVWPTDGEFLDHPPFTFDAWHAGLNMHAYENYLAEFAGPIMKRILKAD